MSGLLQDRLAVITGAGRGIGEAIAVAFAAEGARLVLGARTLSELDAVASRCRTASGAAVVTRAIDVREPQAAASLQQAAHDLGGDSAIDVLVNCAGIYGPIGRIDEVDPAAWVRAIEVNLCGTFYMCQAVLPEMIRRRQGKIINFSGGGATAPLPRFSAYGASKAAVVRLTETLAEEVKEFNVQINAVAPGAVNSRMLDEALDAGERAGSDFYQRARKQKQEGGVPPSVAAELAVFLASARSRALTGKLISAPHDPWRQWDGQIDKLNGSPMFTLRRLDPFTVKPLIPEITGA
jgi:3-oxoacyl-[acyl-carrier protein] reductase